uniref:Uncharacterized protein n=1 Tax=Arundo donax TaxID=35708 RepID=A0A0A9GQ56_ARUDO
MLCHGTRCWMDTLRPGMSQWQGRFLISCQGEASCRGMSSLRYTQR